MKQLLQPDAAVTESLEHYWHWTVTVSPNAGVHLSPDYITQKNHSGTFCLLPYMLCVFSLFADCVIKTQT